MDELTRAMMNRANNSQVLAQNEMNDALIKAYRNSMVIAMTNHSPARERQRRAIAIAAEVRARHPEMQVKRITAPKE